MNSYCGVKPQAATRKSVAACFVSVGPGTVYPLVFTDSSVLDTWICLDQGESMVFQTVTHTVSVGQSVFHLSAA